MARMVAYTVNSSLLRIWTMSRLDCESKTLKTYVPAGRIPKPCRWTPGISTGPLKVMTVFRFTSSALALGENAAPRSAMHSVACVAFQHVIGYPFGERDL